MLGLLGAVALGHSMQAILVDTNPPTPPFSPSAAILGAIAPVAWWLPARRAARVNPVAALRTE